MPITTRSQLGQSELSVSPICLGTWQFNDNQMDGSKTWPGQTYEVSGQIMDRAFAEGINFMDTAEVSVYPIFNLFLSVNDFDFEE